VTFNLLPLTSRECVTHDFLHRQKSMPFLLLNVSKQSKANFTVENILLNSLNHLFEITTGIEKQA
jgi:hypothetical protein